MEKIDKDEKKENQKMTVSLWCFVAAAFVLVLLSGTDVVTNTIVFLIYILGTFVLMKTDLYKSVWSGLFIVAGYVLFFYYSLLLPPMAQIILVSLEFISFFVLRLFVRNKGNPEELVIAFMPANSFAAFCNFIFYYILNEKGSPESVPAGARSYLELLAASIVFLIIAKLIYRNNRKILAKCSEVIEYNHVCVLVEKHKCRENRIFSEIQDENIRFNERRYVHEVICPSISALAKMYVCIVITLSVCCYAFVVEYVIVQVIVAAFFTFRYLLLHSAFRKTKRRLFALIPAINGFAKENPEVRFIVDNVIQDNEELVVRCGIGLSDKGYWHAKDSDADVKHRFSDDVKMLEKEFEKGKIPFPKISKRYGVLYMKPYDFEISYFGKVLFKGTLVEAKAESGSEKEFARSFYDADNEKEEKAHLKKYNDFVSKQYEEMNSVRQEQLGNLSKEELSELFGKKMSEIFVKTIRENMELFRN